MTNLQEFFQGINLADISFDWQRILQALIVLAICLIVIKILLRLANRAISKLHIAPNIQALLRTCCKILLYTLAFLTVANTLGIPITSLLAVFGVAGLAISLAAQNSLAKLAGGLMILVTHPFNPGDYIETTGGISGTVQEIGLAYTRIRTPDNKIILAPNSSISNEVITNFSLEASRRITINIRVAYNHPVAEVKSALYAACTNQSNILEDPPPFVNVLSYEENSIQYTLRAWVKTSDFWPVNFSLLEEVKRSLDAQGIDMSYNRLNVHLQEKAAHISAAAD